jgi:hypothetical protein
VKKREITVKKEEEDSLRFTQKINSKNNVNIV